MKATQFALIMLLLASGSLAVCADSNSAALAKLRQLPPATDYVPKDDNFPKIPLLIITHEGAKINNGPFIPFDQVLNGLAALPRDAWTQGRLILYYDFQPGESDGIATPASAVKQVEDALKSAGIKFIHGTSE